MKRPFNSGGAPFTLLSVSLLDAECVAANRRGEITPRQREELAQLARLLRWFTWSLLAVTVVMTLGLLAGAALSARGGGTRSIDLVGAALVIPIGMLLIHRWAFGSLIAAITRAQAELGRPVAQAVGSVKWNGKTHVAESAGRRLQMPAMFGVALPAGAYCFYVLPESGWILSAERLDGVGRGAMPASATPAAADLRAVPDQALGMTAETLAANRDGQLSGGQRRRLIGAALSDLWLAARAAFGVMLGGALALAFVQYGAGTWAWWTWIFAGMAGFILLFTSFTGLRALLCALLRMVDALVPQVHSVDGPVSRTARMGTRELYGYAVDGHTFQVSRAAYEALPAGQAFRVYYARFSKTVLGMESLSAVPNTLMQVPGRR